jgi:hypothetical protein
MSRRVWRVLALGALVGASVSPAEAAGPWRAQIVEKGTGQPIPGVVVVALYWQKTPGAIHPRQEFHAADEALTDAEGRVALPARDTRTASPSVRIERPEFRIFKAGYGNWRFQGAAAVLGQDVEVRERFFEDVWRRFEGPGVVIEMERLRTPRERGRELARSGPGLEIPTSAAPLWIKATQQEQDLLGGRP